MTLWAPKKVLMGAISTTGLTALVLTGLLMGCTRHSDSDSRNEPPPGAHHGPIDDSRVGQFTNETPIEHYSGLVLTVTDAERATELARAGSSKIISNGQITSRVRVASAVAHGGIECSIKLHSRSSLNVFVDNQIFDVTTIRVNKPLGMGLRGIYQAFLEVTSRNIGEDDSGSTAPFRFTLECRSSRPVTFQQVQPTLNGVFSI